MLDRLALVLLAYLSHEFGHVLACLILLVPFIGIEIRMAGICLNRARVHDFRDYLVSSAGMLMNAWCCFYALLHHDPYFAAANAFMFLFAGWGDVWNMWKMLSTKSPAHDDRIESAMLSRYAKKDFD
jgi:hypothetical protein